MLFLRRALARMCLESVMAMRGSGAGRCGRFVGRRRVHAWEGGGGCFGGSCRRGCGRSEFAHVVVVGQIIVRGDGPGL